MLPSGLPLALVVTVLWIVVFLSVRSVSPVSGNSVLRLNKNHQQMQIGVDSFVAATVDAAGRAVDPARHLSELRSNHAR